MSKPTIAPEGHNSDKARDAIIQAEALEQVEIETIRFELTLRQEESMKRVEAVGITRKAFRESFNEIKRSRNEKDEHKVAREISMEALNAMPQGELFAKLESAKEKAAADKATATLARKAKTDKAKKEKASVVHASADAKDEAAKAGETAH